MLLFQHEYPPPILPSSISDGKTGATGTIRDDMFK